MKRILLLGAVALFISTPAMGQSITDVYGGKEHSAVHILDPSAQRRDPTPSPTPVPPQTRADRQKIRLEEMRAEAAQRMRKTPKKPDRPAGLFEDRGGLLAPN